MFRNVIGLSILSLGITLGVTSAQEKTGVEVGKPAPEFTLKDQNGKEQSLKDLLKKGPVAVVFHRSASW